MARTPEEKLLDPRPGSEIAKARDFGIDLTLTASLLRLTPQQRIDNLQSAMAAMEELKRAREAGPVKRAA